MNAEKFREYINSYLTDTLDAKGLAELHELLQQPDYLKQLEDIMQEDQARRTLSNYDFPATHQRISSILESRMEEIMHSPADNPIHRIPIFKKRWLRYAAAILLISGSLAAWLRFNSDTWQKTTVQGLKSRSISHDVAAGGNKAVLTLADGSSVALDSAAVGTFARQGNTKIINLANGQIKYDLKGMGAKEVMMNTMRTPRGGQYRLTLSDGTQVWLNAASSITFPAAFSAKERVVTITGEVYFEVAKDKNRPFRIESNGQIAEVLGTNFNINTYADEPFIKSTLLEGSLQLRTAAGTVLLTPGQQGYLSNQPAGENPSRYQVKMVDTGMVVAWKNGLFDFNNAPLTDVMRQLARWYDLMISYEGAAPDVVLVGEMQRRLNLSQVLKFLEKLGIRYRLEQRTLIIMENQIKKA